MDDCVFCKVIKGELKSWKVYEDKNSYAFLDIHPATMYHTLIVPKKHWKNIYDIPEKDLKELIAVVKKIVTLYDNKLGISNVQIINSSGAEAQQDVFHLHFHVVPRSQGDGQDITWVPHSELTKQFDKLILKLK